MSLVLDFEESANFSDDAAAKSKDADNKNKSRGNRAPGANIGQVILQTHHNACANYWAEDGSHAA